MLVTSEPVRWKIGMKDLLSGASKTVQPLDAFLKCVATYLQILEASLSSAVYECLLIMTVEIDGQDNRS